MIYTKLKDFVTEIEQNVNEKKLAKVTKLLKDSHKKFLADSDNEEVQEERQQVLSDLESAIENADGITEDIKDKYLKIVRAYMKSDDDKVYEQAAKYKEAVTFDMIYKTLLEFVESFNKIDTDDVEDLQELVKELPKILESSHRQFVKAKNNEADDFNREVVIPRIQLFNDIYSMIEKSRLPSDEKRKYQHQIDLYRSSLSTSVFEDIKKIGMKKEVKHFGKKSFETATIFKLQNKLNTLKTSIKLFEKNIRNEVNITLGRLIPEEELKRNEELDEEIQNTRQQLNKAKDAYAKTVSKVAEADQVDAGQSIKTAQEAQQKVVDDLQKRYDELLEKNKRIVSSANKEKFVKVKDFYKYTKSCFKAYGQYHKSYYFNEILHLRSYVRKMNAWIFQLGESNIQLHDYYKKYLTDISQTESDIATIMSQSFEFIDDIGKEIYEAEKKLDYVVGLFSNDEKKSIQKDRAKLRDVQLETLNKINSLYNNTSNMAVVLDNQFTYMYILKVITYGLQYLGLFFAEKIFSDMYTKQVFVRNKDPPNLLTFYGIYLGFSFAMYIFVTVVLFILTLIFNQPTDRQFAIDNSLIAKYITDMMIYTVFSGAMLCVIGSIMQRKKYFKYKTEGPRAIRAFSEAISIITAINIIFPYFLFV